MLKKSIAMLMNSLIIISLSGCVTTETGSSDGSSQARKQLETETSDYAKTVAGGVALGALIGGAGAAFLTAIMGGDSKSIVRNAAIGAGVGAVAGGVAGKSVADSKEDQVKKEEGLSAEIMQAKTNNAKLEKVVASAQTLVNDRRQEATKLSAMSVSERKKFRSELQEDEAVISKAITAAKEEVASLESLKKRYRNDDDLSTEVTLAKNSIKRLNKSSADLKLLQEGY